MGGSNGTFLSRKISRIETSLYFAVCWARKVLGCSGKDAILLYYYRDCMLDRNRFLVDHAHLLFAVYSGAVMSGTASTINYARSCDKEILILNPQTNHVTRERPN